MTWNKDIEYMAVYAQMVAGRFHRVRVSAHALMTYLAAICLLIGVAARIYAVRPLTNEPMVQAPFHDDGFYYLQIARNFATQGVFTFDGINRTNGFHPLWQLLLVPLARLTLEDFAFIRLVMYFSIALFVLTGILLYKFVTGYGGATAGLAAVILWSLSPDLIMWQNQGMENTVFLPLLILALIQVDRFIQFPTQLREALLLGVNFGLLMWSRSDSILFVALALIGIAIYFWRTSSAARIIQVRALVMVVGLTFLAGLGYLLFNDYAAGSMMSVSGVVKLGDSSSSPWHLSQTIDALNVHITMVGELFTDLGGLVWQGFNWRTLIFKLVVVGWTIIALLGWCIWLSKRRERSVSNSSQGRRISLTLLLVYTFIHTAILTTLLREILRWTPWYIVPQVLTVVVVVSLVLFHEKVINEISLKAKTISMRLMEQFGLARTKLRLNGVFYQASAFGLIVLTVIAPCTWAALVPIAGWLQQVVHPTTLEPRYELAVWLNEHISPDARVGMFDAGLTGYLSRASVINLDGLVNSPEYVAIRRAGDYADYVIENKIEYIVYYYFPPYKMDWWHPTDDSEVCHRLLHVNKNSAQWGASRVGNYFEVVELRYDGQCDATWRSGFPLDAIPPG